MEIGYILLLICHDEPSCVFNAVSPYYKTKLKGLYTTAMQDAESEIE